MTSSKNMKRARVRKCNETPCKVTFKALTSFVTVCPGKPRERWMMTQNHNGFTGDSCIPVLLAAPFALGKGLAADI